MLLVKWSQWEPQSEILWASSLGNCSFKAMSDTENRWKGTIPQLTPRGGPSNGLIGPSADLVGMFFMAKRQKLICQNHCCIQGAAIVLNIRTIRGTTSEEQCGVVVPVSDKNAWKGTWFKFPLSRLDVRPVTISPPNLPHRVVVCRREIQNSLEEKWDIKV